MNMSATNLNKMAGYSYDGNLLTDGLPILPI